MLKINLKEFKYSLNKYSWFFSIEEQLLNKPNFISIRADIRKLFLGARDLDQRPIESGICSIRHHRLSPPLSSALFLSPIPGFSCVFSGVTNRSFRSVISPAERCIFGNICSKFSGMTQASYSSVFRHVQSET